MRIREKIKSQSGFSLAETLVATIILLLVSGIVAEGIPVAKNAYEKVVVAANAKVMLTTAVSALRNELSIAQRIVVNDTDKSITYYSADRGATSRIYPSTGTGDDADYTAKTIMLHEFMDYGAASASAEQEGVLDVLKPGWRKEAGAQTAIKARALASSLEAQRGRAEKLYVRYEDVVEDKDNNLIKIKGLKVCKSSDKDGTDPLSRFGNSDASELVIRVISNEGFFAPAATNAPKAEEEEPQGGD